jgi:hypothetical protein
VRGRLCAVLGSDRRPGSRKRGSDLGKWRRADSNRRPLLVLRLKSGTDLIGPLAAVQVISSGAELDLYSLEGLDSGIPQIPRRRLAVNCRDDRSGKEERSPRPEVDTAPRDVPVGDLVADVLMLPDFERADRIGEFRGNPKTRTFAELLIDCEEDRTFRAVLVGMLLEADRSGPSS